MLTSLRAVQAGSVRPHATGARSRFLLLQIAKAIAATVFLALCAHISVPLPFTPVPITMQTFGILLIAILLGPVTGVSAILLYLVEGAAGLPVFSPQGLGGYAQLTGATAGYLLAYPFAALIAARIFARAVKSGSSFVAALTASVAADALILVSGAAWLAIFLHRSPLQTFALGVMPFIAGELCKIFVLAATVSLLQRTSEQR